MQLLQPNPLRAKLAAGEVTTGTAIFSWSPNIMEAMGLAGIDFVRIDNEHAWRQDDSSEMLVRAAWGVGVVPIIRVDRDDPYLVRKALEIGAGGVIVPDVHGVEEAEAVVRAAKFPPLGERGFSHNCYSGGWASVDPGAWLEWSNREPLVGIMIEHPLAMEAIDDIMAVEGLDFVLFGPADFSVTLGLGRPQPHEPRVAAALERTIGAARAAGKHVMYNPGFDPGEIARWRNAGLTMFELGSDTVIVRTALAKGIATVRDNA